jgi:hypothetical protein
LYSPHLKVNAYMISNQIISEANRVLSKTIFMVKTRVQVIRVHSDFQLHLYRD